MTRIALTDGTGRWFDLDAAEAFKEDTFWDGNNRRSCATRSRFSHEILYRTASGRWVLHRWSQWVGTSPSYEEIDDAAAAAWLAQNDHEPHESCVKEFAELEL